MTSPTHHAPEIPFDPVRSCRNGLFVLAVALLPSLIAVWATPWFVTQDGPAHLYNAQIIAQSADPASPFREVYRVRKDPLPNWAGHLLLASMLRVLPARAADRLMTSLTLVLFAASIVWLRRLVVGWRGMPGAALMAVALALNVTWLLGFGSFLLGACLFPVTLGLWWQMRGRVGLELAVGIGSAMIVGYFCHLISLGLTVVGLVLLTLAAPGERRIARAGWTALGLIVLVPLGQLYLSLTRRGGGGMHPVWTHLTDPFSLRSWKEQTTWADPLSLAMRVVLPFRAEESARYILLAPAVVFALAIGLQGVVLVRARLSSTSTTWPDRRGWGIVACVLILGGLAGPDTFGESHGNYLQQRVVLLGLVALVPVLPLEAKGWAGGGSIAALTWVVASQSAFVWEYATTSSRNVGALMAAGPALGSRQKVATLMIGIRGRFRANPLLHVDNLLGVDSGNIFWSNYETRHYYFPVQFREGIDRPDSTTLETIARLDQPESAPRRASLWRDEISAHRASVDAVLVWGDDPELDRINEEWFVTAYRHGNVRVLRPR